MHEPRPYGKFIYGEGEASAEDLAAAELLVRRLTNAKHLSGLDSLKMTRTLPSGATVTVVDAGGTLRAIITPVPEPSPDPVDEGLATDKIPVLFCGAVGNALAPESAPIELTLTSTTQRRLNWYGDHDGRAIPASSEPGFGPVKAGGLVSLVRFNVRLPPHLQEFRISSPVGDMVTQYAETRPGWWSGAMAEVLQIVGGYGRQDLQNLPEDPIERAQFQLPDRVMRRVRRELEGVRLPGYIGVPHLKGEFQYDYKHRKTHGVTFDDSGAPWLTEVSARGVYAMPLPIIPATATQAFREYMEEVNDDEILWALDRFGGLPSGESFPATESGFEAWRRAGVIIKVCETKDFYRLDPMTMACGWAFNSSGREGFNTGTGLGSSPAIPYCAGFKLSLRYGTAEKRGWQYGGIRTESQGNQERINRYLAGLFRALSGNSHRERAIKYKLLRVPVSQIIDRSGNDGAADVDYWDALELAPIAFHEGSCNQVSRGWIYPGVHPQFKLPEPAYRGCISHSTIGLYDVKQPDKYPKCDTILFGYYIGDDLKVIKYFRDDRESETREVSNFEECMTVGSWEKRVYHAPPRMLGSLYTTDFDERKEVAEEWTDTKVWGVDLGYTNASLYMVGSVFSYEFRVERRRYFGRTTHVTRRYQAGLETYCYVPYMMRNAAVYGCKETSKSDRTDQTAERLSVVDPNKYHAFSYDFSSRWWGNGSAPWINWAYMPSDRSPPNPFMVMAHYYDASSPCAVWADDGEWLEVPLDMTGYFRTGDSWSEEYGEIIGGAMRYTARRPSFNEYSVQTSPEDTDKHGNWVSLTARPTKLSDKEVSYTRFTISPDEFLNVFYQDATRLEAGISRYANMSDTGGAGGGRTRYGYTRVADHKRAHHFIGVINE